MLASSWVGLGAGLLPRCRGRREIALLAGYAVFASYAYGFLVNMWLWPYAIGVAASGTDANVQFVPGASIAANLHRFVRYTLASSTFGWDTGRAITNLVAIVVLGSAVLAALRRAERRASFQPHVAFIDGPRRA
jgi:energy-coupling factor transport system substrate-specific component